MIKIKKIFGIFMLALLMLVIPHKITSASVETNIKRVEEKANTIEISVDKINYEIKSFSISLKIKGDVTLDALTWSDTLSDESIRKNYKYNSSENIIDIYVTSNKNLVEYSNLKVASITVKGEADTNYSIDSNGKFKFIYSDKNKSSEISNLKSNNNDEFKFIKTNNTPDNGDNSEKEEDKVEGGNNSSNTGNNSSNTGNNSSNTGNNTNNSGNIENNSGSNEDKDKTSTKTEEVAKNDASSSLASSETGTNNSNSNEAKDKSSTDSGDKDIDNSNQNKEENLSSNKSGTKWILWGSIFIVLIILSAGIALIYNYKKKN